MVDLGEILGRQGMKVLNDFPRLPLAGGIMPADRGAVGLAADKTVGGAQVDEDGVVGGQGGCGLPVEEEARPVTREAWGGRGCGSVGRRGRGSFNFNGKQMNRLVMPEGRQGRCESPGVFRQNLIKVVAFELTNRIESRGALGLPAVAGFPPGAVEGGFAGMNEEVEGGVTSEE